MALQTADNMHPITFDQLYDLYDAEHQEEAQQIGRVIYPKARDMPFQDVYKWAELQTERFRKIVGKGYLVLITERNGQK